MSRPVRIFAEQQVEQAYGFLNREGGADWTAVKRQTLTTDAEADRVGARLLLRLVSAGHATDPIDATRLMFELIRRLKRDVALAGYVREMLGTRRRGRMA